MCDFSLTCEQKELTTMKRGLNICERCGLECNNIPVKICRRCDYVMGIIGPAIGPDTSKKLTGLLSVAKQYPHQSLNKTPHVWFDKCTHNFACRCFSFNLCLRYCLATLSSPVSFLDVFAPTVGAIIPIT